MERISISLRYYCKEKGVIVDAFAGHFEDVDFHFDPNTDELVSEIDVLCPKCGKMHVFKRITQIQSTERL